MSRPGIQVTVDIVIFALRDWELQVLLIRRGIPPFEGRWALPGGFVLDDESLEAAARRELEEEAGVRDVYLEQLYTFGEPGRDPRGRVVTVAYYALLTTEAAPLVAGTDAGAAGWMPARKHPPLAFDHEQILAYALERLTNKLEYTTGRLQAPAPEVHAGPAAARLRSGARPAARQAQLPAQDGAARRAQAARGMGAGRAEPPGAALPVFGEGLRAPARQRDPVPVLAFDGKLSTVNSKL